MLAVKDLSISFGGLKAVENFEISIETGQLVGLIGPNGAGKTTVFNMLTGVYKPTSGTIELCGNSVAGKKPYQISRTGAARTFQNIRLFKDLSVLDNVKVAMSQNMKYSVMSGMLRLPSYWREEKEADEKAKELIKIFNMEHLTENLAGNLPYGQQRKLEIARALATNPKLLLLDEPAAGMNPTETQLLMDTIAQIREAFSIAILLIEHDMSLVMGICERIVCIDYGKIIATGTPTEIAGNSRVIAAYLGE